MFPRTFISVISLCSVLTEGIEKKKTLKKIIKLTGTITLRLFVCVWHSVICLNSVLFDWYFTFATGSRRGRNRMIVGIATTCVISA